MERGSNRVFYRTDVTFDENNFKLTEEKPVTRRRDNGQSRRWSQWKSCWPASCKAC